MRAYFNWRLAVAALLSVWPTFAGAHKPSDSYLALSVLGDTVRGQWDIALRDLDFALGLDADNDGEITWEEVKSKHKEIAAYAMARLAIGADRVACPATVIGQLIDNHSDGAYAVLRWEETDLTIAKVMTIFRLVQPLQHHPQPGGHSALVPGQARPDGKPTWPSG